MTERNKRTLPLDFVSPYPVDACLSRLRERIRVMRKSSRLAPNVPISIEVFPQAEGIYRFEIQKEIWPRIPFLFLLWRFAQVEMVGYLKKRDAVTLVLGRAGFPLSIQIMGLLLLGAALATSYTSHRSDAVASIFVILLINFARGKQVQYNLLHMVENALRYDDYQVV